MNNQVFLISKCIFADVANGHYHFHFRGCYKGAFVKKVYAVSHEDIKKGEEYLVKLGELSYNKYNSSLCGKVIKIKKLFHVD